MYMKSNEAWTKNTRDMIFNKEIILDKEKNNLISLFLQSRPTVKTVEYREATQYCFLV